MSGDDKSLDLCTWLAVCVDELRMTHKSPHLTFSRYRETSTAQKTIVTYHLSRTARFLLLPYLRPCWKLRNTNHNYRFPPTSGLCCRKGDASASIQVWTFDL